MVDYYEELQLNRNGTVDDINNELSRLESTWRRREINTPEKAAKMIALIVEARSVFKSPTTKRNYDSKLNESKQKPDVSDSNTDRRREFEKWLNNAKEFYASSQFDLARTAIENAMRYTSDADDAVFCELAARVYYENKDYNQALSYINKAIVIDPQWPDCFLTKGLIYDLMKTNPHISYDNRLSCILKARDSFAIAVEKAEQSGETVIKANAMGALAHSLYFGDNPDMKKAEELAKAAVGLGETWGNANKVLESIYTPIYQEAISLEKSADLLKLKQALSKFESIAGWNDATTKAEKLRERIRDIDEREKADREKARLQAEKEEEKRKKRRIAGIKIVLAIVPLIVIVASVILIKNDIQHHKCGENLTWSINNEVLTIKGTGEMDDYDSHGAPWDDDMNRVRSIIVEEGVTSLGSYAFGGASYVTEVTLPDSLEYISYESLSCIGLSSLSLPENIKVIEGCSFCYTDITEIYIPASVEYIDSRAFRYSDLSVIVVDENNAFYSSEDGVLYNKDRTAIVAYPDHKQDAEFRVPDSVTTIDFLAFQHSNVEDFYLGVNTDLSMIWTDPNLGLLHDYSKSSYYRGTSKNYYGIENAAQYPGLLNQDCSITNVYSPNENPYYTSTDGILFSKDYSILYWFPRNNQNSNYVIPEGVTEIAPFACYGFDRCNLESINLPSSLRRIGYEAFRINHAKFSEVVIPEGVEYIGDGAFACEYSNLQNIYLPSTLLELEDSPVLNECTIHYNGTISNWENTVSVYEWGKIKDTSRLSYQTVVCSDGILEAEH